MTVYKDIPEYPGYRAGDDGTIWSCWQQCGPAIGYLPIGEWKQLKPSIRKDDRKQYCLSRVDKLIHTRLGSHLVLEAFIGPRPNGMECCHGENSCSDDSINNIRWDTPLNNVQDKYKHNSILVGDDHPNVILSAEDIQDIRDLYESGERQRSIAEQYNISQGYVSDIVNNRRRTAR